MRTTFGVVFYLITSFVSYPVQAEEAEIRSQVDEVFADLDSTASPGCALSVIRDGEVIYARGYGMANLEHGLAITPQSIFRIGSTSKQFAATAIVLLAEQGKLSLDDDVRKQVPELPEFEAPVTIRHLIHHTSGLRDYLDLMGLSGKRDADYYTDEEVLDKLARQKALNFPPGSEYLYSNSGYFLLSVIVERASGQTLREFADEHMFRPLGMHHTHFHDDFQKIVPNRADGYSRTGDGFEISKTTLEMVGDGGVFTSLDDLFLWDQNFYDNHLGRGGPALIEQLLTPGVLNDGEALTYAFGLVVEEYRGLRRVQHGGAFVGYRAQMIRFPDEKLTVICLCNLAQAGASRRAQQVTDIYLADKLEPEVAIEARGEADKTVVELTAEQLKTFAGRYYAHEQRLLRTIEVRGDELVYSRGPENESKLAALGENRFLMLGVPARVEITFEDAAMIIVVDDNEPSHYEKVQPFEYSREDLARFAGRYYSEELDVTYELTVEGPGLAVAVAGEELEFAPAIPDVFTGLVTLEFSRDSDRRIDGFALSGGRIRNIRYRRVSAADVSAAN